MKRMEIEAAENATAIVATSLGLKVWGGAEAGVSRVEILVVAVWVRGPETQVGGAGK